VFDLRIKGVIIGGMKPSLLLSHEDIHVAYQQGKEALLAVFAVLTARMCLSGAKLDLDNPQKRSARARCCVYSKTFIGTLRMPSFVVAKVPEQ